MDQGNLLNVKFDNFPEERLCIVYRDKRYDQVIFAFPCHRNGGLNLSRMSVTLWSQYLEVQRNCADYVCEGIRAVNYIVNYPRELHCSCGYLMIVHKTLNRCDCGKVYSKTCQEYVELSKQEREEIQDEFDLTGQYSIDFEKNLSDDGRTQWYVYREAYVSWKRKSGGE